MTISQLHSEFKIGLDKGDSLTNPNYQAEEIDSFLNNAQEEFIEQRAYGTNPKRTGLEEDQKRRDDLREVISDFTSNVFTSNSANKPNGVYVTLPANYRHAIQEEVTITYTDCNNAAATKRIPVVPLTHDRYNRTLADPFNRPYRDEVARLDIENGVFELITDGTYTITGYFMRYIKQPQRIQYGTTYDPVSIGFGVDQASELADHTHREIVKIAVTDALQNIESVRYQTQKVELAEVE